VLSGTLETGAAVAIAFLVSLMVARVFLSGKDLTGVGPLLGLALVFVVLRAALDALGSLSAQQAARRVVSLARRDISAHLLRLGPAYMGREQSGEIAGVLVSGMEALDTYVASYLPARSLAITVPLLVMGAVLIVDPPTVLVLLLTGPILLLLLTVIGSRTRSITERRFGELRWLSAFFLDMLRGLATLKMFGRSQEQVDNLRHVGQRYTDTTMEVLRTAFQTSLVLEWSAAIAMALVAVEVGLRLLADLIPFDRALAVLVIAPEFFLPLRRLSSHYHEGSAGTAVVDRTNEILATPVTGTEVETVVQLADRSSNPPIAPSIVRLEAVSVTYAGRDVPALEGLSLALPRGQWVALVGQTGAGKSTVASLLLRFIEPDTGRIEVDGKDLRDVALSEWRATVSWVPQLPHLFHGSVLDNIRLGRADATTAAVEEAAQAAHAHDFIERLPQGYETPLGEGGARLSGGQRQRIAIARAFLRDAPILILDEATSQQDAASEQAIAAAVTALAVDRTVLVISHRLRFASEADRVVVLAKGRVVEQGPPAELMARAGAYRRLVESRPVADGLST
jgi:thiol reductant ABC exporter CydD subunit